MTKRASKPRGAVATELLAAAPDDAAEPASSGLDWRSTSGELLVDIADKAALWAALDEP